MLRRLLIFLFEFIKCLDLNRKILCLMTEVCVGGCCCRLCFRRHLDRRGDQLFSVYVAADLAFPENVLPCFGPMICTAMLRTLSTSCEHGITSKRVSTLICQG